MPAYRFSRAGLLLASSVFSLPAFALTLQSGQVLSQSPFREWFPIQTRASSHALPKKAQQSSYTLLGLPYTAFLRSTQVSAKAHHGQAGILVSSPQNLQHQQVLLLDQADHVLPLPLVPGVPRPAQKTIIPPRQIHPSPVAPSSEPTSKPALLKTPTIRSRPALPVLPERPAMAPSHEADTFRFWSRHTSMPPVRPGDTLWDIAIFLRQNPTVTPYQIMAALFAENPQAFMDHNPNLLRVGATLKIPTQQQVLSRTPAAAVHWFLGQEQQAAAKLAPKPSPAPAPVPAQIPKVQAPLPHQLAPTSTQATSTLQKKMRQTKKAEQQATRLADRLRHTIAKDRARLSLEANQLQQSRKEITQLERQVIEAKESNTTTTQALATLRAQDGLTRDIAYALGGSNVLLGIILVRQWAIRRKTKRNVP